MNQMPPEVRAWWRKLTKPLPAAAIVCAAGVTCAVFAIGINRVIAMRPVLPITALAPATHSSASASPATTATPTPQQASCAGASKATEVHGLPVSAPASVALTDGTSTLDVTVPAGAVVNGTASDVHAQAPPGAAGGPPQPLHGTLVQPTALCVQDGSQMWQIDVPSGAQVDGNATPGAGGAQAQDIHFRVQGQDQNASD
jgi:hypothetical protein